MVTENISLLIDECRRRGIVFSVAGSGFKCSAPSGVLTAELRAILEAYRDAIRGWLFAEAEPTFDEWCIGVESCHTKQSSPSADWSHDIGVAADFVMLLSTDDMPLAPFDLGPGRTVVDREKFLRSIQADVRQGTGGPRAQMGSLQCDLLAIRSLVLDQFSTESP